MTSRNDQINMFDDILPPGRSGNGNHLMPPKFLGTTIEAEDVPRLTKHLQKFLSIVVDGKWRTLAEIASEVGCAQTSASARWRDLARYGYNYEKRRDEHIAGLWHYRLVTK